MKILSIETSCDETAISIVETSGKAPDIKFDVLSNITLSQASLHAEYGGVFPNLAKREHSKNLVPILKKALEEAGELKTSTEIKLDKTADLVALLEREPKMLEQFLELIPTIKTPSIDAIAVTNGPGLEPALWVGVNFAKALSIVWGTPIIPVNHMDGHILASLLHKETSGYLTLGKVRFPAIALLISGGHTELVLMKDLPTGQSNNINYEIIGQTRDDAVGEAFDKVARMLGLPYPGGPEISKLADQAEKSIPPIFPLPRPMINTDDFDFSFSGLKTAVLYTVKKLPKITQEEKEAIALEFEDAVTEILTKKTFSAVNKFDAKTIIIGGGVSANKKIRDAFQEKTENSPEVKLFIPNKDLSTDNALMIAIAGYLNSSSKITGADITNIKANGNLSL